ncbi:MAG TPA: T9SS type A sorting domain-containing protein [Candidatus Didemnitutus sp.]|nr:T9SS type A sorting domain-containing protein [Candidatus Didemnitutus sp.]
MMQQRHTKRLLVLFLAIVVCSIGAHAQRWNWVVPATGPSFDEVWSMGIAPGGDLHLVGTFSDSMNFSGQVVSAYGNYDIFTARYNNKGQILAANGHGGFDIDDAQSIVVDKNGNYYFGGSFAVEALIAGELIDALDESSTDMFVAKFDKLGSLQWVKVFGSPTYDEGPPFLAVDSLGSVYVAGGVGGRGQFGSKSYQSVGKLDAFVAKMAANGDFVWVQGSGSTENDMGTAISVSPNGDRIYASGTFIGQVNFGGNNTIESFAGMADFFVRAFDANGSTRWVKRIGYSGPDRYISSTTQTDGKLVLTGAMSQTTTFDTQTLTANGENASDIFLCRMSKDGAIELLKNYGGTFEDVGYSVAVDAKNNVFIGGYYDSTTTIGANVEESAGGRDGFAARIMFNGDIDWIRSCGGPYDDEIRAIVIDAKNVPYVTGIFETWAMFEDVKLVGERFIDVFVAALDCGPSTMLKPRKEQLDICEGQDSLIQARFGYPNYEWYVNGTKDPSVVSYTYITGGLTEGTYQVYARVTGFDDCVKNTDTITVVVRKGLPVPTVTRVGDELRCSVDDVMYQWYREGVKINGQTGQTVAINGDGLYRVQIIDSTGCDRWSADFLVGTTSVFSDESGSVVTLYPNPTQGAVTIAGATGAEITVTDMLGRVVVRLQNASEIQHVSIDGANGTYAVTLRNAGKVHTMLVTKQ